MTEDELLRQLQASEDAAEAYVDELNQSRMVSTREYFREPYLGDGALDGWSRIVTSEVQDTVEWVLPELLDVFTSTDKAVEFEPVTPDDVQGAQQATDTCNYVFYKQNNGFLTLYTAFKDALMVQNCAVMWSLQSEPTMERQQLAGASAEMLAMAEAQGFELESAEPIEGAQVPMWNATLVKKGEKKRIKVEAFPPEQLLVKRDWASPLLDECPYVCRVVPVTLSELKQMGFKGVTAEDLRASNDAPASDNFEQYRTGEPRDEESEDDSLAEGRLRIEFVLADFDGDGIAERRVIYRLEQKILRNEETDHVQIATTSPVLNTHQWAGMSIAEAVADIQRLKTDLTRALVNGANLSVNPRKTVLTDINGAPFVNLDDLLDYRIGGIVRQTRADALGAEPTPFNSANLLPALEYIDDMASKRTGVSKQQQGLDANALRPDRTAAEVTMAANAAKQRVKLIARIFAETLVKPIFIGLLRLMTSGNMQAMTYRLRGQFVQVDPNEWRDQYDTTINVGLGTGDKLQQMAAFQQIFQLQMGLAQSPFGQLMIQPSSIYATVAKIVELAGQKNVGDFINDPQGRPLPPPQPPPQMQIEQAKMQQQGQMKIMELQQQAQSNEMDRRQQAELEMIRQRAQQQTDAARQQMEGQISQLKLQHEAALGALRAQNDDVRHQREMDFKRWKAELDAATKIKASEYAATKTADIETTSTASAEIQQDVTQ